MKRILALLMGIMMLVSAFAGCSNTANTPSNTDTTPPPTITAA